MITYGIIISVLFVVSLAYSYFITFLNKKLQTKLNDKKETIKEFPVFIDEHLIVKNKMFQVSNLQIITHDVVAHKIIVNLETGNKSNYIVLKNNKELFIDVPNIFHSEKLAKVYLEDELLKEENRKIQEFEKKQKLALQRYEEELTTINNQYKNKTLIYNSVEGESIKDKIVYHGNEPKIIPKIDYLRGYHMLSLEKLYEPQSLNSIISVFLRAEQYNNKLKYATTVGHEHVQEYEIMIHNNWFAFDGIFIEDFFEIKLIVVKYYRRENG
jgi:hypothetical protein